MIGFGPFSARAYVTASVRQHFGHKRSHQNLSQHPSCSRSKPATTPHPVTSDMEYRPRHSVHVRPRRVHNFSHKVAISTEGRGGLYGSHMRTASAIGAPRTSSDQVLRHATELHRAACQPQVVLGISWTWARPQCRLTSYCQTHAAKCGYSGSNGLSMTFSM